MGSDSDLSIMKESAVIMEEFDVPYDITVLSAHRTPDLLVDYVKKANTIFKVIIAGAGGAAHLPGVIAAHTTIPVIGVPINSTPLDGIDSLYSIVQMPSGIPVATMAIGEPGARNAGIYAIQILSIHYPELDKKLKEFRIKLSKSVIEKTNKLKTLGWKEYLNNKK
ncbi:MAG: 5-(carboxyamino)imidazole ribonucleotide mutase [Spirochaetota bacterium]|nr:5-(carboxyamino)imidazole ribonucleotide mutase [Spirochaetota bacterium]